jgi:hypothetical protein
MHRHRQVHFWITEHDYAELATQARRRGETISSIIRRLIKRHHANRRLARTRRTVLSL